MTKINTRLDAQHEEIVREQINKLLKHIDKSVPRSKFYSVPNMAINVIIGALLSIAHNFVDGEEEQDRFIEMMISTLRENFQEQQKMRRL